VPPERVGDIISSLSVVVCICANVNILDTCYDFRTCFLPLPCQATLACRPQKQLRPAPGLGLWIFCVCSEFVTRTEKSNSEPRTQFSAFYSGFRSQADYCFPALGISLSQNDNGTASTAHRK